MLRQKKLKIDYDFVNKSFKKEGYSLLSKEYVNGNSYLHYICPNGHQHKTKWGSWKQGNRCPFCVHDKRRLTYEKVKKSFEKEGYTLISKTYVNSRSYLHYICPNGHKHNIRWNNWQRGQRCFVCTNTKPTYEKVKQSFTKEGYILLSKDYKNSRQYLEYKCSNGHQHKITFDGWKRGIRCPFCAYDRKRLTYDFVKESFVKEGYILLNKTYKNNRLYLYFICPNGHKNKIKWGYWKRGIRCSKCNIKWSKSEKEIYNYIKKIYNGVIIENDRSLIKNPKTGCYLELDIWLPELNKAIEYDGTYWHSNDNVKWRDKYKQQWCKNNNIDLLVIKEQQWIENKDWNVINNFIRG